MVAAELCYDRMFLENRKVCTVKDVEAAVFIRAFADHLKRQGKFELPKWADYVKTGVHKELAPYNPDWLYVRAGAIIRRIFIRGGTGVGGFKKVFGGQFRRGTCTNKFQTASGKVIRYVLQQLEEMGLVAAHPSGGRRLTPEGQRVLDTVAVQASEPEQEE
eukprot:GEMP01116051.1.p1 GENE.GEMP01116051.1~~GEMP01116051.1.p1  ORF type:complete len:172 (-),score=50.53 GEMP01116051.1:130-612(-)